MHISQLEKAIQLEKQAKEHIEGLWKIDKNELEKIKEQNRNLTSEIDKLKVADSIEEGRRGFRALAKTHNALIAEKRKLVDEKDNLNKDLEALTGVNRQLTEKNRNLREKLDKHDEKIQAGFRRTFSVISVYLVIPLQHYFFHFFKQTF